MSEPLNEHERRRLQARVDAVGWYHEFDFGDGVVARDRSGNGESHRRLWSFVQERLDTIPLAGKSVLDIGCWDGYWSFYAERRGAASILATDDETQNWAGDEGLRLAKELLKSGIETNTKISVYELSKLDRRFDVIFCLGLFYHLIDPFYAFAQVRHCCAEDSLVAFEGDVIYGVPLDSAHYSRDVTQAPRFVPAEGALRTLLQAAYFDILEEHRLEMPVPEGYAGPAVHRLFLLCRPARRKNGAHLHRPPFGLHQYDPRWAAGEPPSVSRRPSLLGRIFR